MKVAAAAFAAALAAAALAAAALAVLHVLLFELPGFLQRMKQNFLYR